MSSYLFGLTTTEAERLADRVRRDAGPGWIEARPIVAPPRRRSGIAAPIRRTVGAAFIRAGRLVRGAPPRAGAPSPG